MIRRPESPSTSKGAKVEADSLRLGIALLVGCERDIIFTTSDSKIHGTTWITRTVQAGSMPWQVAVCYLGWVRFFLGNVRDLSGD